MNNLAEKGRPFVQGGDGMMLVGTQMTVDGKPIAAGRRRRGASGRRPRWDRAPVDAGCPGARQIRRCARRATAPCSSARRATWRRRRAARALAAARVAMGGVQTPPQMLPRGVNHQQDWIRACKGGAPGVSEFSVATKYIEWLAFGAIALAGPRQAAVGREGGGSPIARRPTSLLKPFLRKGWELKL